MSGENTSTPTTSSFPRGVTLTTAATYGHATTSSLGPTAGNRFDELFAEDLAVLARHRITDVRLTFDWPRLQLAPGRLDGFWADHIDQVLDVSAELDLRVWATLHDGAVPRWFDDEGGSGDDEALVARWPHWVEGVADRFGDRIHGWVPFAGLARDVPMRAWTDTWGILRAPGSPVVASFAADDLDQTERFLGSADAFGIALNTSVDRDEMSVEPTRDELDRLVERLGADVHRCAEAAQSTGVIVSQFTAHHHDVDVTGEMTAAMVRAADEALADGIALGVVFADPAIQLPSTTTGLLDRDRAVLPAGDAFFATGT